MGAGWALLKEITIDVTHPRTREFEFTKAWLAANYRFINLRLTVPSFELGELLPDARELVVSIDYVNAPWNLDVNSLVALIGIARCAEPATIFEFGTYLGSTTRHLAAACPSSTVFTIDLPHDPDIMEFVPGAMFHGTPEAQRITQLAGDTATFDFSPFCQAIDLVLIDGSHEYDAVSSDSANALNMVSDGGIVIWDDFTTWSGVNRCVTELSDANSIVHIVGTRMAVLGLTPK
jgi:predicted O-methyltransferase YrrM